MAYKRITAKIYPKSGQQRQLEQWFGNNRFLWNQIKERCDKQYKENPNWSFPSKFELQKLINILKDMYSFLGGSNYSSLACVCDSFYDAMISFFNYTGGKPRFKSKHKSKNSVTIKNDRNTVRFNSSGNHLRIPKLGWVKAHYSKSVVFTRILRVTISRDGAGDYHASLLVEFESQKLELTGQSVGLDFGMKELLITSDGQHFESLDVSDLEEKLKYWQRKAARRRRRAIEKGIPLEEAKNYQYALRMVAKYSKAIANKRKDNEHKVSCFVVTNYDFIAIEDIKPSNLMQQPKTGCKARKKAFNHKVANQSWGELKEMIIYKAEQGGKTVVLVNPQYTSQDCSNCGYRNSDLTPADREWTCPNCGIHHDRDVNAAMNVLIKSRPGTGRGKINMSDSVAETITVMANEQCCSQKPL